MTGIYMAMVATECAGFAKVGGLGDVVNDLSHSLADKVNSIAVFLPGYAVKTKTKTVYTAFRDRLIQMRYAFQQSRKYCCTFLSDQ